MLNTWELFLTLYKFLCGVLIRGFTVFSGHFIFVFGTVGVLVCGKRAPCLKRICNSCLATLGTVICVVQMLFFQGYECQKQVLNILSKSSLPTITVHLGGIAYTWLHSQYPTSPLLCGKWILATAAAFSTSRWPRFRNSTTFAGSPLSNQCNCGTPTHTSEWKVAVLGELPCVSVLS